MLGRRQTKGKTNKSKHGVVLVTILFILAIALIFIMSALMLTTATRTRLYTRAEDNQARLTVTAAAESFYQALYMQEITDDQFMKMGGTSVRLVNPEMPGMSADNPNNMTWAYFTKKSDNTMVIDFKTTIGDQTECINMVLDYTQPVAPANSFAHMLNVSKGGNVNHAAVGMDVNSCGDGAGGWSGSSGWKKATADNNTLVFRGKFDNANSDTGNNYYYSDVISVGTFSPVDSFVYGDLVFWGKDAGYELSKVSGTPLSLNGGSIYFVGNKQSLQNNYSATKTDNWPGCGEWFGGNGTVVFYDEAEQTINFEKGQNFGSSLTFMQSDNTKFNAVTPSNGSTVTTLDSAHKTQAQKYLGFDYSATIYSPVKKNDLLTWTGAAAENGWYKNEAAIPGDTKSVDSDMLTDGGALGSGTYKLNGTMGSLDSMPIITCDLSSGNYFFYITEGFTMNSGYFKITNGGGSPNNVFFIICSGATFRICHTGTGSQAPNGNGIAGIICDNCFTTLPTNDGESKSCYRDYDNVVNGSVPHAFIYSMGTGGDAMAQLQIGSNNSVVCTAFIGLYPYDDETEDDGILEVYQAESCLFYGRITCRNVKFNNSNQVRIPYCPEPGSDTKSDKPVEKYSDYSIYDFQYYTE